MRDNDGRTPLHYVFMAPQKIITSIYNSLVKAGANENLIDKVGFKIFSHVPVSCCCTILYE